MTWGLTVAARSRGRDTVTTKFTGQEYDEETGLYYYGARYYDAVIGRFISADSLIPSAVDSRAWNRYAYAANNPVNYVDPTGHSWLSDFYGGIVGAFQTGWSWASSAVSATGRFLATAGDYVWHTARGLVTHPPALVLLIAGAAISYFSAGLASGVGYYLMATALAIVATSVAQAAGVTNPYVLGAIAAVAALVSAAYAAGQVTAGQVLSAAAGWAINAGVAKVGSNDVAIFVAVAMLVWSAYSAYRAYSARSSAAEASMVNAKTAPAATTSDDKSASALPGPYSIEEDAAKAAMTAARDKTIKARWEWGGHIIKQGDDKWSFTGPFTSKQSTKLVYPENDVPDGWSYAGSYHSHSTNSTYPGESYYIGEDDYFYDSYVHTNSYLVTPNGNMYVHYWAGFEIQLNGY